MALEILGVSEVAQAVLEEGVAVPAALEEEVAVLAATEEGVAARAAMEEEVGADCRGEDMEEEGEGLGEEVTVEVINI